MDLFMGGAVFIMLVSLLYVLDVGRRKGERYEYAGALFIAEFGLFILAGRILPDGNAGLVGMIIFAASMFWTGIVWIRLINDYRRRTDPNRHSPL